MSPSVCACPRCPYFSGSLPTVMVPVVKNVLVGSDSFERALYVRFSHSTNNSFARYCFVFSCAMICAPLLPSVSFDPVWSGCQSVLNSVSTRRPPVIGDRLQQLRRALLRSAIHQHETI